MNKLSVYATRNTKVHICIWVVFIAFEIISVGTVSGEYGHPLAYLQNYALHITFFYVHALAVMPCWKGKSVHGYSRFVLLVLAEYVIYICLNYQLNYGLLSFSHAMNETKLSLGYSFILGRTWRLTYFVVMSTGFYFLVTYLKEYQNTLRLEREALENLLRQKDAEMALANATNAALKAQINPHFFSNVLNFMYSRSHKSDPEMGEAIILLSKMMRYAIRSEQDSGKVSIASELEEVRNLVRLWKLIKHDRFFVEIHLYAEAGALKLIPLVLLTLAENIFKHGDLSKPTDAAYLSVTVENEALVIQTNNLVYLLDSNQADRASGLENIRKRLEFEYGDGIVFEYYLDDINRFHVWIKIDVLFL
jgi:two-component system LytT family sensor kinase